MLPKSAGMADGMTVTEPLSNSMTQVGDMIVVDPDPTAVDPDPRLIVEQGMSAYPETGLEANYKGPRSTGKAGMYLISENLGVPCNSACLCVFVLGCLSASDFAEMLRVTTGWKSFDVAKLLNSGQRINLLKRTINCLLGMKREDDRLPKKILTPLSSEGNVPDIDLMLKEYYHLRGLDETGRPKRETLEEAGLKELISKLY